jgi:hypothetical protein
MGGGGEVIETDAKGQAVAGQRPHFGFEAPQRPHRIGQHQHFEAATLRQRDHRREIAVHERLATGKADLADRQAVAGDLVEIERQVGQRQIGQRVIGRRTFDVTAAAGEVA